MKLRFLSFLILFLLCGKIVGWPAPSLEGFSKKDCKRSDLFHAIVAHDYGLVNELIHQGADVNEQVGEGTSILKVACYLMMCECSECLDQSEEYFRNQFNIIQLLIDAGAEITFDVVACCFKSYKQENYVQDAMIDFKQSLILQSVLTPSFLEECDLLQKDTINKLESIPREKFLYHLGACLTKEIFKWLKFFNHNKPIASIVKKSFNYESDIRTHSFLPLNAQTRIFYLMNLFVQSGFNINSVNEEGCNLLSIAEERYMLPDFVVVLLALGADPLNGKNNYKLRRGGDNSLWQQNVFSHTFIKWREFEIKFQKIIPLNIPRKIKQFLIQSTIYIKWFLLEVTSGGGILFHPGYNFPQHRAEILL